MPIIPHDPDPNQRPKRGNPLQFSSDPEDQRVIIIPGENEEETNPTELQKSGLDIEDPDETPERVLKTSHPTPNHPTGRTAQ